MSFTQGLAGAILSLAAVVAPRDRTPWVRAMTAELGEIERGGQALSWAVEGLGAALLWRLRVDGLFLLIVAGLIWRFDNLIIPFWRVLDWLGLKIDLLYALLTQTIPIGTTAFVLVLYRPRHLRFVALILPFLVKIHMIFFSRPHLFSDPFQWKDNHPQLPNWVLSLWYLWGLWWPAMVGAGLAWLVLKAARSARRA
jgi:hypothetical protein